MKIIEKMAVAGPVEYSWDAEDEIQLFFALGELIFPTIFHDLTLPLLHRRITSLWSKQTLQHGVTGGTIDE